MNGPQHYREAEVAINYATNAGADMEIEAMHLRYAQVHATLALAAATARPGLEAMGWEEVTR